jgi:hypothetical protein
MSRRMVKPVSLKAEVEPKPERRTEHGIKCACGSKKVRITNTISNDRYPAFIADRAKVKKQKCVCDDCGKNWWRRVEVTERELPSK